MLTCAEKKGCEAILQTLNTKDLISLTATVTKGLVKAETREEAVHAIVSYSIQASHLLHRRKVKKEVLFQYLKNEGRIVPADGDKEDFVKACLHHWGSAHVGDDVEHTLYTEDDNETMELQATESNDCSTGDLVKMGLMFATWYYGMLSSNLDQFVPQHFWPQANLELYLQDPAGTVKTELVRSDSSVASKLLGMVLNDRFHFDPNMSEDGISAEKNTFGLVKVNVKGILHRFSNPFGCFVQQFGLVRDPSVDRWRIKHVALYIKSNS